MFEYKYFVLSVQGTGCAWVAQTTVHKAAWPALPCRSYSPFLRNSQTFGNKKDVGVCLLRTYPHVQAFALPLYEDKQRKPAHVKMI